jgi:hypothetical protein
MRLRIAGDAKVKEKEVLGRFGPKLDVPFHAVLRSFAGNVKGQWCEENRRWVENGDA